DNIARFKPPKNRLFPEEEENILAAWNIDTVFKKNNNGIDRSTVQWIKPPNAWHKLNFDGASKGNLGDSGGGGVIKYHRGCFVATFSGKMGRRTNHYSEALAALWGIRLARDCNIPNIIID
ncbi:hypothetical protein KI387_037901, partial [Taxus chinensis]